MKTVFLKPQDVYLALKLITMSDSNWRMVDISQSLGISQSEVSQGLQRLKVSQLVDREGRIPLRNNLYEYLIHALKYTFPANFGSVQRGVPTAHSAPPLTKLIKSSKEAIIVWPWPDGDSRGESLAPLYPSVPGAAIKDPKLYMLLALVDAVRVGRAREKKIACTELKKIILEGK